MVLPKKPNTVYVKTVMTGCLKRGFDLSYPSALDGIIVRGEYQQSIYNINQHMSFQKKPCLILSLIIILLALAGMITLFVGGIMSSNEGASGFPLRIGIGLIPVGLAFIVAVAGWFCIESRRRNKLRQAIAQESMKYSARSPIPCTWQLDITRLGNYDPDIDASPVVIVRLAIEIGRSTPSISGYDLYQSNQVAPYPPILARTTGVVCSRCGTPRDNPMAKFCSSCNLRFIL